ncbi:MAG: hypothetical protein KID08_27125, partial [Pseudomonas putida]|nr:hypothetical protein [Pseudomonas putida]
LFQNVSATVDLKPYISCLLRDSAARKGWVISHRYYTHLQGGVFPVGAGMPAKRSVHEPRQISAYAR